MEIERRFPGSTEEIQMRVMSRFMGSDTQARQPSVPELAGCAMLT